MHIVKMSIAYCDSNSNYGYDIYWCNLNSIGSLLQIASLLKRTPFHPTNGSCILNKKKKDPIPPKEQLLYFNPIEVL